MACSFLLVFGLQGLGYGLLLFFFFLLGGGGVGGGVGLQFLLGSLVLELGGFPSEGFTPDLWDTGLWSTIPRPSIYPLLDPKCPLFGAIYPYLRAEGGSWYFNAFFLKEPL